jgi:hypothetical protein
VYKNDLSSDSNPSEQNAANVSETSGIKLRSQRIVSQALKSPENVELDESSADGIIDESETTELEETESSPEKKEKKPRRPFVVGDDEPISSHSSSDSIEQLSDSENDQDYDPTTSASAKKRRLKCLKRSQAKDSQQTKEWVEIDEVVDGDSGSEKSFRVSLKFGFLFLTLIIINFIP